MKKIISTSEAPAAIGPYSQATVVHGFAFLSGQIPLDPATGESWRAGSRSKQIRMNEEEKAACSARCRLRAAKTSPVLPAT